MLAGRWLRVVLALVAALPSLILLALTHSVVGFGFQSNLAAAPSGMNLAILIDPSALAVVVLASLFAVSWIAFDEVWLAGLVPQAVTLAGCCVVACAGNLVVSAYGLTLVITGTGLGSARRHGAGSDALRISTACALAPLLLLFAAIVLLQNGAGTTNFSVLAPSSLSVISTGSWLSAGVICLLLGASNPLFVPAGIGLLVHLEDVMSANAGPTFTSGIGILCIGLALLTLGLRLRAPLLPPRPAWFALAATVPLVAELNGNDPAGFAVAALALSAWILATYVRAHWATPLLATGVSLSATGLAGAVVLAGNSTIGTVTAYSLGLVLALQIVSSIQLARRAPRAGLPQVLFLMGATAIGLLAGLVFRGLASLVQVASNPSDLLSVPTALGAWPSGYLFALLLLIGAAAWSLRILVGIPYHVTALDPTGIPRRRHSSIGVMTMGVQKVASGADRLDEWLLSQPHLSTALIAIAAALVFLH